MPKLASEEDVEEFIVDFLSQECEERQFSR